MRCTISKVMEGERACNWLTAVLQAANVCRSWSGTLPAVTLAWHAVQWAVQGAGGSQSGGPCTASCGAGRRLLVGCAQRLRPAQPAQLGCRPGLGTAAAEGAAVVTHAPFAAGCSR